MAGGIGPSIGGNQAVGGQNTNNATGSVPGTSDTGTTPSATGGVGAGTTGTGVMSNGGTSSDTQGSTIVGNGGNQQGTTAAGVGGAQGGTIGTANGGAAAGSKNTYAGTAGATGTCTERIVAPLENGGLIGDLVYDSENRLHVGYIQAIDLYPVYARRDPGQWKVEAVPLSSPATNVELAVDATGIVHAMIEVTGTGKRNELVYVRREPPGEWSILGTIALQFRSIAYSRFYLDADSRPSVVFAADVPGSTHELRQSVWSAGAWVSSVLATMSGTADDFALNLDSLGRPWIAAKQYLLIPTVNGYRTQYPAGWSATALDFAFNSSGTEVYLSEPGGMIFGNGSFWGKETISDIAPTALPILHLTSDARLVAAVPTIDPDHAVTIYQRSGTTWSLDTSANLAGPWGHAAVAAAYERPHAFGKDGRVAQFGDPGDAHGLRVLEDLPDGSETYDLDVREGEIASSRRMIVTSDGPTILAYRQDETVHFVLERIDGTWDETLPSISSGADVLSLTLDPDGQPTVGIANGNQLGYATLVSRNWITHWVGLAASAISTDTHRVVVTFDAGKAPHVCYTADGPTGQQLWHLTSGDEAPRLVYASVTSDSVLSALSDAQGIPHVVFNGPTLCMARWVGSTWQTAVVAGTAQGAPASYVDANGRVCVGEPAGSTALRVSCDDSSQIVSSEVASGIGSYKQLTGNSDGTISVIGTSTSGASQTLVYKIDLKTATKTRRAFQPLQDPSVLLTPDGGLRLAHFNSEQQRLYLISCGAM